MCYFNPRPPWGGRLRHCRLQEYLCRFQSTPSVGRATEQHRQKYRRRNISIHALRGEGDRHVCPLYLQQHISIHALRGEGDNTWPCRKRHYHDFNPRPPWGGRLRGGLLIFTSKTISIHALRGEGDILISTHLTITRRFQSTPSVGRATTSLGFFMKTRLFQSTPSVGRATNTL